MADGRRTSIPSQASPELPPRRGLSLSRRCQSAHHRTGRASERAPAAASRSACAGIGFYHGRYSPYAGPPRRRPDLTWHPERRLVLVPAAPDAEQGNCQRHSRTRSSGLRGTAKIGSAPWQLTGGASISDLVLPARNRTQGSLWCSGASKKASSKEAARQHRDRPVWLHAYHRIIELVRFHAPSPTSLEVLQQVTDPNRQKEAESGTRQSQDRPLSLRA